MLICNLINNNIYINNNYDTNIYIHPILRTIFDMIYNINIWLIFNILANV